MRTTDHRAHASAATIRSPSPPHIVTAAGSLKSLRLPVTLPLCNNDSTLLLCSCIAACER
ncbi:hypothetical protein CHELA17_63470 [Chelatococcus asaccharovorans]|nr:hypothetical protein CHELA17_63470 [Chelatococcus asaccharovorans]